MDEELLKSVVLYCMESDSDIESDDESMDSSSDSCDDTFMKVVTSSLGKLKRNCIEHYMQAVFPTYSEKEFVTHFRVSSELYQQLVDKFSTSSAFLELEPRKTYSAGIHLALFLWFAGHEACSYRDVADRFSLSLGTVFSIINRVIFFLSNLCESAIKWPTEEKKVATAQFMENKTGMYGVIGVIDGTRIRIDPPKTGRNDYIDRKNVTSVCLQGICDEKRKFIDIFVGHPGSVHDNRVYVNSTIYPELPAVCGNFFLLGDSAYACSKYLITPYRDNGHLTSRQKFFNRKLSSGRIVIEHSFGILKQRFRQLYYCKLRGMKKICHFVRACIVLHNMCNEDDLVLEVETNPEIEINLQEHDRHGQDEGFQKRNVLCDEVFNHFNQ